MSVFLDDARRFLSPLSTLRTETVKNAIDSLWTLSFSYANVFFVNEIMKSIVAGDEVGLKVHVAAFAAFVPVFWAVRTGLRKWGYVQFRHRVMGRLFSEYSKKFLLFSNEDFERFGTSKVSHTLDKGVTSWSKLLHEFVRGVATIAVTFAVMSYLVISASPILYFAFLALLAVSLVLNRSISKRTREAKLVRAEVIRETNRHIVRMAMSKFEILLSDRSSGESAKFAPLMNRLEVSAEPSERWSRLSFSVLSFSLDALRITLYLAVGLQIFRGENSIAFLVSTIAFLGIIERNLLTLSSLLDQFQQEFVFVRELWTMSDRTPAMAGYESGIPFISGDGAFDLRNVSFRYSEDSPYVLENLNLEVSWNRKIALVWPSGGGKSTLVKLLSGYFEPTSGRIEVDGQDLSAVSKKTYYERIGYLSQEPSVFDGTVRENLLSGSRSESDADIENALAQADCGFVNRLHSGLDTEIGERGVHLSGGQKQKLAIAKVFLKNPEIVFLDEPTAALDSFSEDSVMTALDRLLQGRTTFVVAHRLKTVKGADEILVVDAGKIVERGTHETLMAKGGTYFRLVELQSGF